MNRTKQDEFVRPVSGFAYALGFSLVEMLVVIAIIGVLAGVTIPMTTALLASFRSNGDLRSVSNGASVAKMRAAAAFSATRLRVDLTARTFIIERFTKATPTCCWVAESGATALSSVVSFGYGAVATAPPSTQPAIQQAPACLDD